MTNHSMQPVNLSDKLSRFSETWSPRIVGELNNQHVKLAKFDGEFVWHSHEHEDEMFLVLDGVLELKFRDGSVTLKEGELYIVPRGVEHLPIAHEPTSVLLFEPSTTVNTGASDDDRRVDPETLERI